MSGAQIKSANKAAFIIIIIIFILQFESFRVVESVPSDMPLSKSTVNIAYSMR